MLNEVWRDVAGYEGLYEVSSRGRVRGLKRGNVLKPALSGGYLFVVLCKEGKRKDVYVHRLVATAFCPRDTEDTEVNHLNEIKTDNRADNLEWCTRLENIQHGTGIARHAEKQMNDHRSKPVRQLSLTGELVKEFPSVGEVVRVLGYDKGFLLRCISGKRPTAYGYRWQYV